MPQQLRGYPGFWNVPKKMAAAMAQGFLTSKAGSSFSWKAFPEVSKTMDSLPASSKESVWNKKYGMTMNKEK